MKVINLLALLGLICLAGPLSAQIKLNEDFETCTGGCPDFIEWKEFWWNEVPNTMATEYWEKERFQLGSGNWESFDWTDHQKDGLGNKWNRQTEGANDYLGVTPATFHGDRANLLTPKIQISKKSLLFFEYRADHDVFNSAASLELYWTDGIQTGGNETLWQASNDLNSDYVWTERTIVLDKGYNSDRQLLFQVWTDLLNQKFELDNLVIYEMPAPVAEYKMEGNGDDASGNGLTAGVPVNVLEGPDRHNISGKGYQFRGSQFMSIVDNNLLDFTDAFSMTAWIKINPSQTGIGTIAGKAAGAVSNYAFGVEEENGKYKLRMELVNGANTTVLKSTTELDPDTWYHVACTFDKPTMTLVINGVEDATATFNHSLLNNPEHLRIGRESWHSSLDRHFNGFIDDLAVYDQALYWKYIRYKRNQEKPTTVVNQNYVAEIDAASSINVQEESTYDFGGHFTIETQFRSNGFVSPNEVIISKGNDAWTIRRNGTTNQLIFDVAGAGSVVSQTSVNDQKWHHVAGVYDGTNLKIYIDGYLEDEAVASGTPAVNNQNVTIGANPVFDNAEFFGQIDETRIWSSARSAAQIKDGANTGLDGDEPGLLSYWRFNEGKGTYAEDSRGYNGAEFLNTAAFTNRVVNVDVNEAPTNILLSSSQVNEGLPADTKVGDLSTTDVNLSDTFTYELVAGSGDADNDKFNIPDVRLFTNETFDFETKSSYSIRVRSTDNRGLFFDNIFTINVVDLNEAPTDISISNSTAYENVIDEVGQLTTTDENAGNTFTYSLITGTGDTDNATFEIIDDKLWVQSILDYEAQPQYSVRIETKDNEGATFEKAFTITAKDTTDNRGGIFDNSKLLITQDDLQGVGTVSMWVFMNTLSSGTAQTIANRHSATASQNGWNLVQAGESFRIQVKGNGAPKNINSINFIEDSTWYHLAIAFDYNLDLVFLYIDGVYQGEASIAGFGFETGEVWLGDSPDNFWSSFDGVMDEVKVWNKVLTANQIKCEMGNFSLIETDGALTYLKLDVPNASTLTDHSPGGTSTFAATDLEWGLSLDALNQAPTGFIVEGSQIHENESSGILVAGFSAIDPNDISGFAYELVAGAGDDFNDHFSFQDNVLYTTDQSLDYESNTTVSIRVKLTDPFCLSYEGNHTFEVIDVGENPTITVGEDIFVVKDSGPQTFAGWATNISDGDSGTDPVLITLTAEDQSLFSTQPKIAVGNGDLTFESASGKTGETIVNGVIFEFITDPITMEPIPGATTSFSFNIKITEFNTAPTVANPIADQNLDAGFASTLIDLANIFTDAEGHALMLSASSSDVSVVSVSLSDTDLTITEVGSGSATITVTANDDNGGVTDDVFVVNIIIAGNNSPTVASPIDDVSVQEGFGSVEVNVANVFSDTDADALSITAASSDESVATVSVSEQVLTITEVANGATTITVTAADGKGGTVDDVFIINVNAAGNNSPSVANPIADSSMEEGFGTVDVNLTDVFSDADADALSITASSSNVSVVTVSIAEHVLTLTEVGSGTAVITVTASDGRGGSVTDDFEVIVTEKGTVTAIENGPAAINIYPNPFEDKFTLELPERGVDEIGIYDLLGNRIFYQLNHIENNVVINTDQFKRGVYMIRLRTTLGIISKKIVKN
ncbi:LamG-like jellyroll fold domain-containing protein [Reichenbachiella sp.]|uniref:LamG-like jellyroll fold domain-containing protein n=2 Tax=Reichenbachiella sp. TaxID=2184521 RepID=UPI003297BC98